MRNRRTLIAILLPLTGLAAGSPEGESAGGLSSITPPELLDHVKFLSDDALGGRAAGSEGGRKAAEYIAERFKSYGVEPLGPDGSYFQEFEFPLESEITLGEKNRLEATGASETRPLEVGKDWNPFSFSSAAEASGTLLFAGYGVVWKDQGYDDYAGVDAKGKVALVLRHTPGESRTDTPWKAMQNRLGDLTRKARWAEEHGAAALLVVNDPNNHPDEEDRLVSYRRRFPRRESSIPCAFVSRAAANRWLAAAGVDLSALQLRIDRSLAPSPLEVPSVRISLATEVRRKEERVRTANVAGILRGSDPALREECVVLGAHYDHLGDGSFDSLGGEVGEVHNGADDNASGTAGLLEVAQALAPDSERPRRSVVFIAFGAEERGLIGSRHYVENPLVPLSRTAAMVNLDMIGRSEGGAVEVGGAGTAPGLREDLARWNQDLQLSLTVRDRFGYDSDHAPFAEKKVPVLFFFSGLHPDYHRPTDDWPKLNSVDAARIARLACRAVVDLGNRPDRPAYTAPGKLSDLLGWLFSGGRKDGPAPPYLGVQVGDAAGGEGDESDRGVALRDVLEGGPAALAGLLKGDTVIAIDGTAIASLDDLRRALEKRKPGDTLELEVRRKVRVKLSARP